MKPIRIPDKLLELNFPWNVTYNSLRIREMKSLPRDQENLDNALAALQISLQVLSSLPEPILDTIHSELTDYWGFTAETIAEETPTFDCLAYSSFQKIVDLHKIDSSSEKMLEDMVDLWIWTTTRDIASQSLIWLENSIDRDNSNDDEYIDVLLKMAMTYWHKIPEDSDVCSSLIGIGLMNVNNSILRDKSMQFLEEVEQNSVTNGVRKLARDYKKLILSRDEI
jgi:hypothetical protein